MRKKLKQGYENLVTWFTSRKQDYHAKKRGEVRTARDGSRGRVFAPDPAKRDPGVVKVTPDKVVNVEMIITRADGSIERRKARGHLLKF